MAKFKPDISKRPLKNTAIRLTPEEHKLVKTTAELCGLKHAEFMRQAIMYAIDNMEIPKL